MLSGRLALVTGGGSGIGAAVCRCFAKNGAKVAVVDIHKERAIRTADELAGEHCAFSVDVSSAADVMNLMVNISDTFSQSPSIAVNCAGITRDKSFLRMDEASFDSVIAVNLKGSFLINKAVAISMIKAKCKNGSIINISSIVGKLGNIGQANYTASKAGVVGLTKTLARELARHHIRCNAVLPGFILTPMVDTIPEKVKQMILSQIPLATMGQPEDVAATCLFLASDDSNYITGTTIEVAGGFGM